MLKMERCEFCERDDEEEDMDAKLSMRKINKGVGDFGQVRNNCVYIGY